MNTLLLAGWLLADIVTLKTGGQFEGIVREDGLKVVIETHAGTISISRKYVSSVQKSRSVLHEYYERYEEVKDSRNADDFYELALWAREHRMTRFARELHQRTINQDPDHEAARRALGYKLYKGRWMTEEEINLDRGLVKFEKKWMTLEDQAEIIAGREKAKSERIAAREKAKAERAERRRKKKEDRRMRAKEAARRRAPNRGYRIITPYYSYNTAGPRYRPTYFYGGGSYYGHHFGGHTNRGGHRR